MLLVVWGENQKKSYNQQPVMTNIFKSFKSLQSMVYEGQVKQCVHLRLSPQSPLILQ